MSALDLEAARSRALALRNMIPGHDDGETPYVVHGDDVRCVELDEHDAPHFQLESRVYVADHCRMATVPTCDGVLMHDTAEAIAKAGADMLALIARVKELETEATARDEENAEAVRVLRQLVGAFDDADEYDDVGLAVVPAVEHAHDILKREGGQ